MLAALVTALPQPFKKKMRYWPFSIVPFWERAFTFAPSPDDCAATSRSRRLVNIATRGQIGTGEDVLIAGLVVTGSGPRTYLIRAVGPTLTQLGVPGAIDDPFLQIYQGETLLRENVAPESWDADPPVRADEDGHYSVAGEFDLVHDNQCLGYGLLAVVVERITARAFPGALSDLVLEPLGRLDRRAQAVTRQVRHAGVDADLAVSRLGPPLVDELVNWAPSNWCSTVAL